MSVNDQDYFRDLAVHFENDKGLNERSIVFTHAKITLEEYGNVKEDFVTIKMTVNQRRDKFTGVMFGINLDDTYKRAWERANNPPTLNIIIPSDINKQDLTNLHSVVSHIEYVDALNEIKKGKLIFFTHGFTGEPSRWDYMIQYMKGKDIELEHLGEIKDGVVIRKNSGTGTNFKKEALDIMNSGKHVIFTLDMGQFEVNTTKNMNKGTFWENVENLSKELYLDIDFVRPIGEKVVLIGHSLGGLINMGYAVNYYTSKGYMNSNLSHIDKMLSFNSPYNGARWVSGFFTDAIKPNSEKNLSYYWNNCYEKGEIEKDLLFAIGSIHKPYYAEESINNYNEVRKIEFQAHDGIVTLPSQLGQDKYNPYLGFNCTVFAYNEEDTAKMNVKSKVLYTTDSLEHTKITSNNFVLDYAIDLLGV